MSELLAALGPLAGLAPETVLPAAIVFTRMSLLVFLLPGLGARAVPARLRVALALLLTFLLLPALAGELPREGHLVPVLLGELMVGAYLGFAFRVLVFALSVTGTIVAQALSLSQIFGAGMTEDSSTTTANLLSMAGITLFLTSGLHLSAYGLLLDSYDAFPAGQLAGFAGFAAERALRMAADGFAFGFALALPFVLMNLAYNAVLGLLSRAMPQLMVTFVGMPAVTFAGLSLLAAASGLILTVWLGHAAEAGAGLMP